MFHLFHKLDLKELQLFIFIAAAYISVWHSKGYWSLKTSDYLKLQKINIKSCVYGTFHYLFVSLRKWTVETASFVEKEPSKVAVRFIGQTLHYERNLLPQELKSRLFTITRTLLLKVCRLLLHLHLIYFSPYTLAHAESVQGVQGLPHRYSCLGEALEFAECSWSWECCWNLQMLTHLSIDANEHQACQTVPAAFKTTSSWWIFQKCKSMTHMRRGGKRKEKERNKKFREL